MSSPRPCPHRRDALRQTHEPTIPQQPVLGGWEFWHTSPAGRGPRVSNRVSCRFMGGAHYTFFTSRGRILHEKEPPSIPRHGAVPLSHRFQNRISGRHHLFLAAKPWISTDPTMRSLMMRTSRVCGAFRNVQLPSELSDSEERSSELGRLISACDWMAEGGLIPVPFLSFLLCRRWPYHTLRAHSDLLAT
ncbi:hypothetical protein LY78DRAFT_175740 [Colletotrichum sublineola]|nr:hypothetical protein LY78DRAFT_175740 [Colletotrichum sublineola]